MDVAGRRCAWRLLTSRGSPVLDCATDVNAKRAHGRSGLYGSLVRGVGSSDPTFALAERGWSIHNASIRTTMSIDPTWLFLSLFPSGIGFVLLVYGRKQQRWPHIVAGLLFMAYPYVATTVTSLVAIGALLGAGLWYVVQQGW